MAMRDAARGLPVRGLSLGPPSALPLRAHGSGTGRSAEVRSFGRLPVGKRQASRQAAGQLTNRNGSSREGHGTLGHAAGRCAGSYQPVAHVARTAKAMFTEPIR
jgi:hypothetical protein